MSSTWMRLNTCPGLTIRRAVPARKLRERVAAGAVDAGEAEDVDGLAGAVAELEPGLLGREPPPRARADRRGRRVLVDPAAAMVAIDADRREVADPGEPRRGGDRGGEMPERRVALRVRRDRDQERVGAGQGACDSRLARSRRRRSKGSMPSAAQRRGLLRRRLPSRRWSRTGRGSAARSAARVAEAEGEQVHAALSPVASTGRAPLVPRRSRLPFVRGTSRVAATSSAGRLRCREASMRAFGSNRPTAPTPPSPAPAARRRRASRTASAASPGSPELPMRDQRRCARSGRGRCA